MLARLGRGALTAYVVMSIALMLSLGWGWASARAADLGLGGLDCSKSPTAADIVMQIREVSNFDAESNGGESVGVGHYTAPKPGKVIGSDVQPHMKAALDEASREVLTRLCRDLTYFFVDANADKPYAFWESQSQLKQAHDADASHTKGWTFIGIPKWIVTSEKLTYGLLETAISNALVNNGLLSPKPPYTVSVAAKPDGHDTALLAIIAHEEGHIFAYKYLLESSGKVKCKDDNKSFTSKTWTSIGPLPRFHVYNTPVAATHDNDIFPHDIAVTALTDLKTATVSYQSLFDNGDFVSLFSALAPDEDIAETFKYHVLLHATTKLNSLVITYPDPKDRDIYHDVLDLTVNDKAVEAHRKLKCIADTIGLAAVAPLQIRAVHRRQ